MLAGNNSVRSNSPWLVDKDKVKYGTTKADGYELQIHLLMQSYNNNNNNKEAL